MTSNYTKLNFFHHQVALRRRKESLARGESLDKPRARASADLMRKQMSVDPSDVRLDDKPDVKVQQNPKKLDIYISYVHLKLL